MTDCRTNRQFGAPGNGPTAINGVKFQPSTRDHLEPFLRQSSRSQDGTAPDRSMSRRREVRRDDVRIGQGPSSVRAKEARRSSSVFSKHGGSSCFLPNPPLVACFLQPPAWAGPRMGSGPFYLFDIETVKFRSQLFGQGQRQHAILVRRLRFFRVDIVRERHAP